MMLEEAIPDAVRRFGTLPDWTANRRHLDGRLPGAFPRRYETAKPLCRRRTLCRAWRTDAETPPGAFDDAEDFARHDVPRLARRGAYAGLPVWLDVRSRDGFRNADLGFAKLLGTHGVKVRSSASPGAHETSYWDAHMRNYLRFYADALARCDAD